MNNKTLNIIFGLALAVIVGVMSWHDMHPRMDAGGPPALPEVTYYAGPDITPAMMPGDDMPLTIGQGDFSYPGGKTVWTPHGLPPTTFAQRQVNLQFRFNGLPRDPAATIDKIKAVISSWERQGDTVNVVLFDYSPEGADLKAYAAFLKAAHAALYRNYAIFITANLLWAEGPQKERLEDLRDSSPLFVIPLPQARISPELFSKLAAFKYSFWLQFPAGTLPANIDAGTLKKLKSLEGITLTLDPHKPVPKTEEKVGLFPKL